MSKSVSETKQERCLRHLKKAYELMPFGFGDYVDAYSCKTALRDIMISVREDLYKEWK